MDIINLSIDRTRHKLWLYGTIALALIMGLTFLVGANKVAAHEGLEDTVGDNGVLVQTYDTERDEHVVHVHAVGDVDTWQVYFGSSRALDCGTRQSGWRDYDESSRSSDIVVEAVGGEHGLTLTLDSGDHNLGVCVRYDNNTSLDPDDPNFVWTYADADPATVRDTNETPVVENAENLVVDLRGPSITIGAAESNMMEIEVDGLKEGSEALEAEDVDVVDDANNRIRYAFFDSSACDATTLTVDTRYGEDASETSSLIVASTLSTVVITDDEADSSKDGATFKINTAWANHGKYLCLEVTDQVGNTGYASKMIDVDFPVTLTQIPSTVSGEEREGKVSVSSSEGGVEFSYSSLVTNYQRSDSDCSGQLTYSLRVESKHSGYKYDADTATICMVAEDSKGNEIKIAFVIDRMGAEPTITAVIQSNQIVYAVGSDSMTTVTASSATVDLVRSNTGQVRWESRYIDALAYDGDDPDPDAALGAACNADQFKGSGNTYATYTTGTRNSRIDLSENSAYRDRYDAICFRIRDVANQETYLGELIKDFTVQPVIEGDREENSPMMSLSITGVEGSVAWSWSDAELADDCSSENSDEFGFSEPSPNSTITVEEGVAAYCVRATVGTNNHYGIVVGAAEGETLDSDGPMVTVGDVDSNMMISATATDSGSGVDADSWQYTVLANEDAARDNCDDEPISVIPDNAWMDGSSFTVTAAHSNKYVCFRVMDEVGNYGYSSAALPTVDDTTAPTLTVTQSGNTLTWNAQDDGGIATYEYQMFDSAPANCDTDSGWMDGMKATLAETDNGMHYCFRVIDHGGNATSAGPLAISGVDTTRPTVTVSQSANTVSAIPGELNTSDWQFYRSDEDPGDNCSDRYTGWSDVKMVEDGRQITGLTTTDSGKWVCFRVMDAAGNYGYKKFQIETITEEQEETRTASDGSLEFSLEGNLLTVSLNPAEGETEAAEVISWNYLYWSTESLARSYCDADRNQFDSANPGTRYSFNVASRHLGNWFCFRAIDENNEEAFGVFQVPGDTEGTVVVAPEQPPITVDPPVTTPEQPTTGEDTQQPAQPGQPGGETDPGEGTGTDPGSETTPGPDPTGESPDPTEDPDVTPPADDDGFLSEYLWYIIGAVVVVILIVVFVAMGSKGNQRE